MKRLKRFKQSKICWVWVDLNKQTVLTLLFISDGGAL